MGSKRDLSFNSEEWTVKSTETPFKLFKISNVFSQAEDVIKLSKELDKIDYVSKMTDMFRFSQTKDLEIFRKKRSFSMITKFLQFLDDFRVYLVNNFNLVLNNKVSVSSSKYSNGDFLLCHDDKCDDRYVAFIFYLNSMWKKEWGGSLDLFSHDDGGQPSQVMHSIFPEFNSMVFFEVGKYTYHQVVEVLTHENSRVTINGWFHSENAFHLKPLSYTEPNIPFVEIHDKGVSLFVHHFINNEFLYEKYYSLITEAIRENGTIMLQSFLKPHVFRKISNELSSHLKWKRKGPANRWRFDVADLDSLSPMISAFLDFVQSNYMCSYLEAVTGFKLFNNKKNTNPSAWVHTEIQFWRNSYYSLLTDCDTNFQCKTLDVWLFFNVQKDINTDSSDEIEPGNINYCKKGIESLENIIEPNNNSICLVTKGKNLTSFVSYISEQSTVRYHALSIRYKIH